MIVFQVLCWNFKHYYCKYHLMSGMKLLLNLPVVPLVKESKVNQSLEKEFHLRGRDSVKRSEKEVRIAFR